MIKTASNLICLKGKLVDHKKSLRMIPNTMIFNQSKRIYDLSKMTLENLMVFQEKGKIEGVGPSFSMFFGLE